MKNTKKRALYVVAALLAALFVLSCLAGFAACGGGSDDDCGDGKHTVETWTTVTEATCTSKGSESGTCTVCGKTVTQEIPMKDHTSDNGTVTKEATCTEKGEMTYKCTVCNQVIGTQDIDVDSSNHDFIGSTTAVYVETNEGAGQWEAICSRCGVASGTALSDTSGYTLNVSTEAGLVAAATAGGNVMMTGNIALTDELAVTTTMTLDLAGYTLGIDESWTATAADNGVISDVMIFVTSDGGLTIKDSSEEGTGKIDYSYVDENGTSAWGNNYTWSSAGDHGAAITVDGSGSKLIIYGGDIETTSVGIRAKNGEVEINDGTIHSTGFYVIWEDTGTAKVTIDGGKISGDWGGILVDGDSNFKGGYGSGVSTLIVNGGEIYSGGEKQGAIRTESKTSTESAYIEINGGKITCADNGGTKNEAAIFLANGTLKITDGEIMGPTALEIQAGVAVVSGGTFTANYGKNDADQNVNTSSSSSDPFSYGYALAIYPRANVTRTDIDNFSMAIDVTISGGTFYGDVYVSNKAYNDYASGSWIVSFEKDDMENSNYVVAIDDTVELNLTPIDSDGNEINEGTGNVADHYIWKYVAES